MTMVTGRFEQVADAIARRTAEMLCASVSVVDERGTLLASGIPAAANDTRGMHAGIAGGGMVRVPIHLDGQSVEVLITAPLNGEVLSPRLVRELVELMLAQSAVVELLPNRHDLKNRFIYDLLRGTSGDAEDILREAQILGMDLSRPRAVVLIDIAEYLLPVGSSAAFLGDDGGDVRRFLQARVSFITNSIVSFFELPTDTICAYIGKGEMAILKASRTADLQAWSNAGDLGGGREASWANLAALKRAALALLKRLRRDTPAPVTIGIGRYHPGIAGLARSYEDARTALTLGQHFHGRNQVHCLDEIGVAAFVGITDERTKFDLALHLLSPLDHEPELLDTLAVFFAENCSSSTTACRLNIHRNTLSYRLDKITSLTGLDARRFDDAVQIRLALILRTLSTDPGHCASAQ